MTLTSEPKQRTRIVAGHGGNIRRSKTSLGIEAQRIRISHGKGIIGAQQQMVTAHHRAQELQRRRMVHDGIIIEPSQVR